LKTIVTGRNEAVTERMKAYAVEKIEKLNKFFGRVTTARVTLDIANDENHVEMMMDVARGTTLVSKAKAPDMFAACDLAEQKLGTQLRKFKERLTDHHRGERRPEVDMSAPPAEAPAKAETTYEEVIEKLRDGE
jgi:putative sigma-54 modulation protein